MMTDPNHLVFRYALANPHTMHMETQKFKKGTLCVRCGCDRKEQRKYKHSCSAWGVRHPAHLWNKRDFQCVVHVVSTNPH